MVEAALSGLFRTCAIYKCVFLVLAIDYMYGLLCFSHDFVLLLHVGFDMIHLGLDVDVS